MNHLTLNAAIMSFAFSGMLAPHRQAPEPDHATPDVALEKASADPAPTPRLAPAATRR